MRNQSKSPFFRQYNLAHPRHNHTQIKEPVEHQKKALSSLHNWYRTSHSPRPAGALLVLPPGGGKTFTTMRFLCTGPLSDGYKVLWLAHTHHLLEQALDSLGTIDGAGEFSAITSTKNTLNARVVSGTQGHFRLAHVDPSDDFLIGTLQTFSQGYKKNHSKLQQWIKAAKGKLVVVFDEAHHAPATTYSEFICNLREQIPGLKLLGLTATPTYTDKTKLGWFDALFPQHIQYQISNTELIAAGVLAVPDIQVQPTNITPDFDPIRCAQWARTFTDLPEDIVTNLAANANRNNSIADHYLANRNSFGKTIIFCDRWAQCEYIRKRLERGGVRAGAVYCHKDASPSTPEARNARSSSENAEKIESFKRGELDVLLNVRMLTEGTDVPAVQTVFLTRQTTSQILITQMVGRAMRGPRFGGTKTAQIVSFIDNWQQQVQWATFAQPQPGPMASGLAQRTSGRVTLVPIELVRRLSMMMQDGTGSTALSFKSFMPVGWYVTSFPVQRENEDTDWIEQFVLVYEEDAPQFDALLSAFMQRDLASFQSNTDTCDMEQSVDRLKDEFFPAQDGHVGSVLSRDISALIRHTAHHGGPPTLVTFAQRDEHNLDELAQQFLRENVGVADLQARLYSEYQRTDRLWSLLFRSYDSFDTQYYQAQKGCLQPRVVLNIPRSPAPRPW